jgi:putative transposase
VGTHSYFLTLRTFSGVTCFTDPALVNAVWLQFRHSAAANQIDVLAYCFMPDHVHLLVKGTSIHSDLRAFVNMGKQRAAYAGKPWLGGRLWQPGYYDRVLRDDDDAHDFIKYILENPVRAGLANAANDYPFAGAFTTAQ